MGRRRNNPDGLPKRVYEKHGALHYVDNNGKWHRLGTTWNKAAKDEWAKHSSDTPHAGTVAAMLDAYLSHLRTRVAAGKGSSRHLADREADSMQLCRAFGTMDRTAVKRKHVAHYLANRKDRAGKPAPIRANREISMLSAAFNRDTELDFNPCLNVPRNEENVRTRDVSGRELRCFAKRCCPRWLRVYLLLKLLTGLRMGDMLRLSDTAETERGLVVNVGKSRGSQVLEFRWTWALRTTVGLIHRLRQGEQGKAGDVGAQGGEAPASSIRIYFAARSGNRRTLAGFKSAWRRAMTQWKAMGGTPFWEHDVRAATASKSTDLQQASERLGHAKTSTTKRHYRRGNTRVSPLR